MSSSEIKIDFLHGFFPISKNHNTVRMFRFLSFSAFASICFCVARKYIRVSPRFLPPVFRAANQGEILDFGCWCPFFCEIRKSSNTVWVRKSEK